MNELDLFKVCEHCNNEDSVSECGSYVCARCNGDGFTPIGSKRDFYLLWRAIRQYDKMGYVDSDLLDELKQRQQAGDGGEGVL